VSYLLVLYVFVVGWYLVVGMVDLDRRWMFVIDIYRSAPNCKSGSRYEIHGSLLFEVDCYTYYSMKFVWGWVGSLGSVSI
jgi:hypothetical protein